MGLLAVMSFACGDEGTPPSPSHTTPENVGEPIGSVELEGSAPPSPSDPLVKPEDPGDPVANEAPGEPLPIEPLSDEPVPPEGTPATPTTEVATVSYPGPCSVRWSNGAAVRFLYSDTGGTIRVDQDKDGKADHCAAFETKTSRVTRVRVDETCNGGYEFDIVPTYETKANIATSRYEQKSTDGSTVAHDLTLVTMPSFVGVEPGYAIHAKRSDIAFEILRKRVMSARVTAPSAGPPLTATFAYDRAGRITSVDEDFASDGTVDRRLELTYDAVGNVTKMSANVKMTGDKHQLSTADLDYGCHAG